MKKCIFLSISALLSMSMGYALDYISKGEDEQLKAAVDELLKQLPKK